MENKEIKNKYLLDLRKIFSDAQKSGKTKLGIWQAFNLGRICEQERKRTLKQNNAIHKYCQLLAEALNAGGLDMKKVLRADIDIEWTMQSVKDYIWRPIQISLFKKQSTTELLKSEGEIEKIYDHINRHLANNPNTCGLEPIPFPKKEEEKEPEISYPVDFNDPDQIPW